MGVDGLLDDTISQDDSREARGGRSKYTAGSPQTLVAYADVETVPGSLLAPRPDTTAAEGDRDNHRLRNSKAGTEYR